METTMTTSADPSTARARKPQVSRSGKTDRPKDGHRVKKTIVMDRKLESLLMAIASFQDMDASELAAILIDRGLRERHPKLYDALCPFEPKIARRAKPDASVDTTDRAGGGLGVRDDEAAAA